MIKLEKLKSIDTPSRYCGGEARQCIKNGNAVSLRVALVSPAIYEMGMFDFDIKSMYYILNTRNDAWCERCFAPMPDFEKLLKDENEEIYTLESKTPLKQMDVIIFVVSSELMYTNILNIMSLANIPAFKSERTSKDPLIIMTGSAVSNPKPLEKFTDAFVIGEMSSVANEVADLVISFKDKPRQELLKSMKIIPGVYIPGVTTDDVYMARELDYDSEIVPKSIVVPNIKTMIDKNIVMLSKGCNRSCVNCTHKYAYGKPQYLSLNSAIKKTKTLIQATGNTEIMFMSNCYGNYPDFHELIYKVQDFDRPKIKDISFMEVKMTRENLWLLKYMKNLEDYPSIIMGGPTKRLQDILGIEMAEEDAIFVARKVFEAGFNKIRLKYIIGTPTETYEDLTKILNFANRICKVYKEVYQKSPDKYIVELNLYNFKSKPHTPSEFCATNNAESFELKQRYLKDKNKNENIIIVVENGKQSEIETMLARGDEKVGDVIYEAYKLGSRNEYIDPMFSYELWQVALNNTKVDIKKYLEEMNYKMVLPWDNIHLGTPKEELVRIYVNKIKGD